MPPQATTVPAPAEQFTATSPTLSTLVVSALGELACSPGCPEALQQFGAQARVHLDWLEVCGDYLAGLPAPEDAALFSLRERLGLTALELLSVSLALCVERDTRVSRLVGALQAPVADVGPTLGLLQSLFVPAATGESASVESLLRGAALESGLLELHSPGAALVERSVRVPLHLVLAVAGVNQPREGYSFDGEEGVPLPSSTRLQAAKYAEGLARGAGRALVVRSASVQEGRSASRAIASALGLTPLFVTTSSVAGLAPWLYLNAWLPVFQQQLGPAERFRVPDVPGYRGPVLVLCSRDGNVELARGSALSWRIAVPSASERRELWQQAIGQVELAVELGSSHRHGISRIAELGKLARQRAEMEQRPVAPHDLREVALSSSGSSGLTDLAEPVTTQLDEDALVLPAETKRELKLLATRCRFREDLACGLGATAKARYHSGVRALFTGNSGTGKTLAASWLSTLLGFPLYRVDVASIVSKYIGETERNLAQLLASAEHAEVMLLFDEADSLFGKRTEVKQSNDRFANTQTNYLLQRMETYEGIVLLTSNNRSRFDSAFTRRLDFVIDFPDPRPEERRSLWLSHLGGRHELSAEQVNQLAMGAELMGGNIRNVVLCAAVLALSRERAISWEDIREGLVVEYRKLGKQLPPSLSAAKSLSGPGALA